MLKLSDQMPESHTSPKSYQCHGIGAFALDTLATFVPYSPHSRVEWRYFGIAIGDVP